MSKPRGYVVWKGPSALDGSEVVLIATRGSTTKANRKTGSVIQTYILQTQGKPHLLAKEGLDEGICGKCPHKPSLNGTCYVRLDTGPNMVYRAYTKGSYPVFPLEGPSPFAGEVLRMGSYGDPVAIPLEVWGVLLRGTVGHTGYTHQWKEERFSAFKGLCMASCDNLDEDRQARGLGWRTFTVLPKGAKAIPAGAFLCPASEEAGKKLTCSQCLACDGTSRARHASIYIPVHGIAFKITRFSNLITIGKGA